MRITIPSWVLWLLNGILSGVLFALAVLFAAAVFTGCATSHALPTAPDGGPAFQGDGGPDGPECLTWAHPEGFPEDVRCIVWAGDDAGARGCRIVPFDRPGDQAGACARD